MLVRVRLPCHEKRGSSKGNELASEKERSQGGPAMTWGSVVVRFCQCGYSPKGRTAKQRSNNFSLHRHRTGHVEARQTGALPSKP